MDAVANGAGAGSAQSHMETAMNWDRIEGNWKQIRGKVREQWGKLTDDHLEQIKGNRDQLVGKIQEAYGYGRDQAEQEVRDWETNNSRTFERDYQ